MAPSFQIVGETPPASPVVLSVPHAGRDYPLPLRAALRAPVTALTALEDRYVDVLAREARGAETLLIQGAARAWIDLNRAEHERDPLLDEGARSGHQSAKVRAGLGLVPRRTAQAGDLWRRRFGDDEIAARIAAAHRPYHQALADQLAAARARHGVAVLVDIHSMPPLGAGRAGLVLGDRFGRSAAARFVHRVEEVARATGAGVALNTPYAGGYVLERHGRPRAGVHAIQLEVDRSLYLDARLDQPGSGMARAARWLRAMLDALADEALAGPDLAVAAE